MKKNEQKGIYQTVRNNRVRMVGKTSDRTRAKRTKGEEKT